MRGRATAVAAVAVGLSLALSATALAAPAGKYSGTTSEKGIVSFTVVGHRVTKFTAQDGYSGACHFSGGVGGLKTFSVTIASIPISTAGRFSDRVTESNTPFPGSTVIAVTGRFTGAKAVGTVTAVGKPCGSSSETPSASLYLESYSATRH